MVLSVRTDIVNTPESMKSLFLVTEHCPVTTDDGEIGCVDITAGGGAILLHYYVDENKKRYTIKVGALELFSAGVTALMDEGKLPKDWNE